MANHRKSLKRIRTLRNKLPKGAVLFADGSFLSLLAVCSGKGLAWVLLRRSIRCRPVSDTIQSTRTEKKHRRDGHIERNSSLAHGDCLRLRSGRRAVAATKRANSALLARYGEKIVQYAPRVKDFVEGALIEEPPAMTGAAGLGAGANIIYKWITDESK